MAARAPVQHVECFHLVLLRLMEVRIDRADWVVKGGVNLRAWFGSRRYSEDLDVDVLRGQRHVLEEKVDRLIASRSFADLLSTQGLTLVRTTKPKQTDTTQRWKFEVQPHGAALPVRTRAEFSRRGSGDDEYALESARTEVVRPYGIPAPAVNHYTAASAIRQKIAALGARAETQARDVWDLDHLLRTTQADPRPLAPALQKVLPQAIDRALMLPFDVFKAQVIPYLSPDDQELFGTEDAWTRMCELVAERLSELAS